MVVRRMTQREKDIECFYRLLVRLEKRVGGKRTLDEFSTGIGPPMKGVYFFFEPNEYRSNDSAELRVVRVGTHTGQTSTAWTRLFEHKIDYGRSVFRDHVRAALRNRTKQRSAVSYHLEQFVSRYIGKMPFLWVKIDEAKSRKFIERNAVALLSNWCKRGLIDPPSKCWLGQHRYDPSRTDLSSQKLLNNRKVASSGLWNVQYVGNRYCTNFLEELNRFIDDTPKIASGSAPCMEPSD